MTGNFRRFGDILCILLSFSIVILTTAEILPKGQYLAVVRITIGNLSKIHKISPKRRKISVINFEKFHKLCFSHNKPKSSKKQQCSD